MIENSNNDIFNLAADIVANTSRSIFLTGKAGTGKTTFLHHIRNTIHKNTIVAAPTGVAAINAGGVTLHSLLQLPFEPFIPNYEGHKKLDYHFKLRKSKIEMLQELELLIIDEVSMLRADMLDAIDYMLRRYRNSQELFGGVQMLFIGDLFQLPPVVQQHEWNMLRAYYSSPFFFHAQALNGNMPVYIELKEIYRQSDLQFIDILNRIRNNQTTKQDLVILNKQYNPTFKIGKEENYVTLCTHNYQADKLNLEGLENLEEKEYSFSGSVNGDFAENSYPTDLDLRLKKGAQVMFVKNDAGEFRQYYNGKLAVISHISEEDIAVRFESGEEMTLEKEIWRNVRYSLNEKTGEIEEEEIGYFSQYPIRLAWAITIHKSQGLTFDKLIIDAGQAFAAGQVYVALSRCTSLEGIVLYSRISEHSIHTDSEAIRFGQLEQPISYLKQILEHDKPIYNAQRLKKSFSWTMLTATLRAIYEYASEKNIPKKEDSLDLFSLFYDKSREQAEIARNFCREIDRILYQQKGDITYLKVRIQKASIYFHEDIISHILTPLNEYIESIKNRARVKAYLNELRNTQATISNFLLGLEEIFYGDILLTEGIEFGKVGNPKEIEKKQLKASQKGSSQRISLFLFKEGKSLKEIAEERDLTSNTIENHLAGFIASGEIEIKELMAQEKIEHLSKLLGAYNLKTPLKEIKDNIPKNYSYFDVKAVLNYLNKKN